MTKHKVCLTINGVQSVRFEKGTIKFKSYFKQIPDPSEIYDDFECNIMSVESYDSKKKQDHIPCSLAYKLVCVDEKFTEPIVVFRGEYAAFKFFEAMLKEYEYCKRAAKKTF